MNTEQFTANARLIGLGVRESPTMSPSWDRVFLIKDGISIARASLQDGVVKHLKWYSPEQHLYEAAAWVALQQDGRVLPRSEFFLAQAESARRARAEHKVKQEWRDANPKKGSRPKLAYRPNKFISEILGLSSRIPRAEA